MRFVLLLASPLQVAALFTAVLFACLPDNPNEKLLVEVSEVYMFLIEHGFCLLQKGLTELQWNVRHPVIMHTS